MTHPCHCGVDRPHATHWLSKWVSHSLLSKRPKVFRSKSCGLPRSDGTGPRKRLGARNSWWPRRKTLKIDCPDAATPAFIVTQWLNRSKWLCEKKNPSAKKCNTQVVVEVLGLLFTIKSVKHTGAQERGASTTLYPTTLSFSVPRCPLLLHTKSTRSTHLVHLHTANEGRSEEPWVSHWIGEATRGEMCVHPRQAICGSWIKGWNK